MAVYKVPQDVEAEDKLLGPFSMRQFIYLIIAAMGIAIGWALAQVLLPLALIPAPMVILFLVLALPLKKDQPMETYLMAIVSFHFIKPRRRMWQPDGITSLVEITAPKEVEPERTKNISAEEAGSRLDYLTTIVDSRGWAIRGGQPAASGNLSSDLYAEADTASDMLGESNAATQNFDRLISEQQQQTQASAYRAMQQAQTTAPPHTPPQAPHTPPTSPVPQTSQAPADRQAKPQLPAVSKPPVTLTPTAAPAKQTISLSPTKPKATPPVKPNKASQATPAPTTPQPIPMPTMPAQPSTPPPSLPPHIPTPTPAPTPTATPAPTQAPNPFGDPYRGAGKQALDELYASLTLGPVPLGEEEEVDLRPRPQHSKPSPEIVKLTSEGTDLSVASLAREAHRLEIKHTTPPDSSQPPSSTEPPSSSTSITIK